MTRWTVRERWGVLFAFGAAFGFLLIAVIDRLEAQTPIASTVATLRAQYPTPMTREQLGDLLIRAAQHHQGWGVLSKTTGNRCPSPVGEIACDILVDVATGVHFDVLANIEEDARPVWRDVGPIDRQRIIPIAALTADPPPPTKPDPPAAPPAADVARLEQLEQALADAVIREMALTNRVTQLEHAQQATAIEASDTARRAELKLTQLERLIRGAQCRASMHFGATKIPLSCAIVWPEPGQ